MLADQVLADQVLPDQLDADHELADHVLPDQELADHELADHVLPFQLLPDQLLELASACASPASSTGFPKMSWSPVRVTPSRVTWSLPRDCSSEPLPFAAAKFCPVYDHCGVALSIAPSLSSPAPCAWLSKLASFTAFVAKKRFTRSGDIVGYFCNTSATAPDMSAADCELPLPRK